MTPTLITVNAILAVATVVGIVGLLASGIVAGRLRSESVALASDAPAVEQLAA
jgi:hypothetical protein